MCLFGRIPLPVWFGTEIVRQTAPVTVTLSREEARAQALAQLRHMIREAAEGGQLAGRMIRVTFTEDSCRAEAALYVTRDIGRTAEFTAAQTDAPGS